MTSTTIDRPKVLTASTVSAITLAGVITASDSAARTISGTVLTIGEVGNTSVGRARFTAGALTAGADPSRIKLLVEHDRTIVAGYCTAADEVDGKVVATFRVADGPVGDEILASAAQRLRDGLSVGVDVISDRMAADGVLEVTAAAWRETSVVALPAFPSAQVQQVAAALPQGQQPAAAAPLPVMTFSAGPARPRTSWATLPDQIAAAYRSDGLAGCGRVMQAALSDIVPPNPATDPEAHEKWFGRTWLGELWYARKTRRPLIDALGAPKPLTSMGKAIGYQLRRPALNVAPYAGNKAQIPTGGNMPIEFIERASQRFAGGHDVDRAFFDFGDGEFVRTYFELQVENYLASTEAWFAAALLAEATDIVGAPETLLAALVAVAGQLGTIGASLDVVKIGSGLWTEALQIRQQDAPWLFGGSATVKDGSADIGGIKIAVEPGFGAREILALDRRAATFYEWKNPPLKVEAVNVPQGGVDLAVFGYASQIVNDPASVLSGLVAPAPAGG